MADVAFLIGGADGHGESLLEMPSCLSFGAMTWPHLLARAMLAEQIYRAQQIFAAIRIIARDVTRQRPGGRASDPPDVPGTRALGR